MSYELEYETQTRTTLTDAQKERLKDEPGTWLRVYYDESLDSYYIDDFEFLSLVISYDEFKPSGAKVPHYVLWNDIYDGNIERYLITIPGSKIIKISKETLKILEEHFKDRIDYVFINLKENKTNNYANQIEEFKDYIGIKNLKDYKKIFTDFDNSNHPLIEGEGSYGDVYNIDSDELIKSLFDDNNRKL